MKVILGYGWRKSSESLEDAFWFYGLDKLHKNQKDSKLEYIQAIEEESISPLVKPKYFRVVIEEVSND